MPAWIIEMAAYMKELDPNHLVTSGGEGFWGADNSRAENNPQMPASRSAFVLVHDCSHLLQPATAAACWFCRTRHMQLAAMHAGSSLRCVNAG